MQHDKEPVPLDRAELSAVSGGTEGYPGLPLGTHLNTSIWSRPFDFTWVLVGATGTVPR